MRSPIAIPASLAAIAAAALIALPAPGAFGRGAPAAAVPVPAGTIAPAPVTHGAPPPRASAPVLTLGRLRRPWQVAVRVAGRPVSWAAQRSGVTLVRFDQRGVRLELHPGTAEPGGGGWRYASRITGSEAHRVVAAFNAGFKFDYGSLGFMLGGRTPVRLSAGLASVVTYRDGTTQIGAWDAGVPARGKQIVSVRQNLSLLVDHGLPAGNLQSCVEACWGATDAGLTYVARSALGITAAGALVWAAGQSLSPAGLARALVGAGVERAVELDINPEWVGGFLYAHRRAGPRPVALVQGQPSLAGGLLRPYSRDFFTVVAR